MTIFKLRATLPLIIIYVTSFAQLQTEMPVNDQKKLYQTTFKHMEKLLKETWKATNSGDTVIVSTKLKEIKEYCNQYSPLTKSFPVYFCRTKDSLTLKILFNTFIADSGNANNVLTTFRVGESENGYADIDSLKSDPNHTLGECYICLPDLVIRQVNEIKKPNQRSFILTRISIGILNHFDVFNDKKDRNKIEDENYKILSTKLDSVLHGIWSTSR